MKTDLTILDYLQFDSPTKEQKSALLGMANFVKESNSDDFFVLSGAAGTGKTSITTALIGLLNAKGVYYQIAAPTGRAARILGRKSKTLNSTIHSLIYSSKLNPETGEVFFTLKENPVKDYSIYIIDEASMIPSVASKDDNSLFKCETSLLSDLITFTKAGNKANKIVFLGDKNQLPPIHEYQSKALSTKFLRSKFSLLGDTTDLTEVKRQKDGTEILKNACALRVGIEKDVCKIQLNGFERLTISKSANAYVKDYLHNGYQSTVSIGATHNMNNMFNKIIRERIYGSFSRIVEQDDLLLITQSWRRNGSHLYSGDHVVIKEIDINKREEVAGLNFVPVKLESKNLEGHDEIIEDYLLLETISQPKGLTIKQENNLRHERYAKNKVYRESGNAADDRYVGAIRTAYGHSITCNKAQGGEWDNVYLNSFYMPTLRYQYTAITRAKNKLILY